MWEKKKVRDDDGNYKGMADNKGNDSLLVKLLEIPLELLMI